MEAALRGAISSAKIVAALHRHSCIASETRRSSSSILRRISCIRPRSGIWEHFIIRVTVASEQTRADNATLRENAAPWTRERVSEAGDTRQTRIEVAAAALPFSESFRFISFFEITPVLLLRACYKTADFLLFLIDGTKVDFNTYSSRIFGTQVYKVFRKWNECKIDLIPIVRLEVVYFKC